MRRSLFPQVRPPPRRIPSVLNLPDTSGPTPYPPGVTTSGSSPCTADTVECLARNTHTVPVRPLVTLRDPLSYSTLLSYALTGASGLNMVTRMGSIKETADFATAAEWYAGQYLDHVYPVAARQSVPSGPTSTPTGVTASCAVKRPRPSTAGESRLTRVSGTPPRAI